jgi:3-oxoacyl-[acyl-carrier-protein] synthase II
MVISEGGGLLILEELERARRRGARIYAEVCGFGAAVNSSHWLKPRPEGRGLSLAIIKALADAKVNPADVGLVNAFGVGTQAHDLAEAAGIRTALGETCATVPVLATKGALGNNGAGSGAIDLAVTAMAVHRGVIPPSLNTTEVDSACGLKVVRGDPADVRADVALSVATALSGGQTAALVIRRFQG